MMIFIEINKRPQRKHASPDKILILKRSRRITKKYFDKAFGYTGVSGEMKVI